MAERTLVTLQDRKRVNLARIARHDRYLVHEEPDGTLIWEPAEVMTVTEARLAANQELTDVIAANRADPSRLRRRDRSSAPRDE
jgi:prophage tail gpP-like protein